MTELKKQAVSEFGSVDPAPASGYTDLQYLQQRLNDEELPMFQRMRAVFSLRNIRSDESALALCDGFSSSSALLRHEIAYVLGQMQNPVVLDKLSEVLSDENEHVMVRHEAAEAMGAIGDLSIVPILEEFKDHSLEEIAESCMVALDLLDWVNSSEFEEYSTD